MSIPFYAPAISYLRSLLEQNLLAHAYLFSGPDSEGKLAVALALARSLERCESLDASLERIWHDKEFWKYGAVRYPFMDARVCSRESFGIDEARSVRDFILTRPLLSGRRMVIIPSAHNLSTSAQQALLKVSEDASESALIICIAPCKETLLGTFSSRYTNIYFKNPRKSDLAAALEQEVAHSSEVIHEIVELSRGAPGACMTLVQQPEEFKRIKKFITTVESGSAADLLAMCDTVETDDDLDRFFEGLLRRVNTKNQSVSGLLGATLLEYRAACARLGTSLRTQLEAAVLTALS